MIKFNKKIEDCGVILGVDLALYHSGFGVYEPREKRFLETFCITINKDDEKKLLSLFNSIQEALQRLVGQYGKVMVIQERLPNACGPHSTVFTLQQLASAHAIMKLAAYSTLGVELYDEDGVHSTTVKAMFKTSDLPKPQKSDIRRKVVELYCLDDSVLTDDISDAIAVVHTLINRKWNADIDEQIKQEKKEIKALKSASAKEKHQNEINRLLDLKI